MMHAKTSISAAVSYEATLAAIYLNKVGLVIFAYFNALMIAWLLNRRGGNAQVGRTGEDLDV